MTHTCQQTTKHYHNHSCIIHYSQITIPSTQHVCTHASTTTHDKRQWHQQQQQHQPPVKSQPPPFQLLLRLQLRLRLQLQHIRRFTQTSIAMSGAAPGVQKGHRHTAPPPPDHRSTRQLGRDGSGAWHRRISFHSSNGCALIVTTACVHCVCMCLRYVHCMLMMDCWQSDCMRMVWCWCFAVGLSLRAVIGNNPTDSNHRSAIVQAGTGQAPSRDLYQSRQLAKHYESTIGMQPNQQRQRNNTKQHTTSHVFAMLFPQTGSQPM